MRATEFIIEDDIDDTIDSDMRNRNSRQARLKAEVEAGLQPVVQNTTGSSEPVYTMGDLQDLGWMEKEYTHDGDGEVDGWIRYYDGPGPVRVATHGAKSLEVLNPGGVLEDKETTGPSFGNTMAAPGQNIKWQHTTK